jgi:hypothetical protein
MAVEASVFLVQGGIKGRVWGTRLGKNFVPDFDLTSDCSKSGAEGGGLVINSCESPKDAPTVV